MIEDDRNYAYALVLFILLFTAALFFFSGIPYFQHSLSALSGEEIRELSTNKIKINYSEVEQMNFPAVKSKLGAAGYSCSETYLNSSIIYEVSRAYRGDEVVVYLWYDQSNMSAHITGHYLPESEFSSDSLSEKKQIVVKNLREVTEICGITADLENIEWVVDYSSSWP